VLETVINKDVAAGMHFSNELSTSYKVLVIDVHCIQGDEIDMCPSELVPFCQRCTYFIVCILAENVKEPPFLTFGSYTSLDHISRTQPLGAGYMKVQFRMYCAGKSFTCVIITENNSYGIYLCIFEG
jgi:hypothetical protein